MTIPAEFRDTLNQLEINADQLSRVDVNDRKSSLSQMERTIQALGENQTTGELPEIRQLMQKFREMKADPNSGTVEQGREIRALVYQVSAKIRPNISQAHTAEQKEQRDILTSSFTNIEKITGYILKDPEQGENYLRLLLRVVEGVKNQQVVFEALMERCNTLQKCFEIAREHGLSPQLHEVINFQASEILKLSEQFKPRIS